MIGAFMRKIFISHCPPRQEHTLLLQTQTVDFADPLV